MNADGTGLTNLTKHASDNAWPYWAPDGKRIAFTSDRDGNFEIYTMNPDGTALTNLTAHPATDAVPAWGK